MELNKFGQGLKNSLQNAADAVKNKAGEVDFSEVKKAGEAATNRFRNMVKRDGKKASVDCGNTGTEASVKEAAAVPECGLRMVTVAAAIKIIYFLMSADGEILHGEEEKFNEIGKELDPDFENIRDQIVKECKEAMDKTIDPEDYFDTLCDGIDAALLLPQNSEEDRYISSRHLLWNLLSVAYSDESYDDSERRLIKHIVRKLDVDKAVFIEMESSIQTLMDIEKEVAWIKTTDRPYLKIESMVNELENRKNVIFESITALIAL